MKSWAVFVVLSVFFAGCTGGGEKKSAPRSSSGVKKARVKVETNERGLTVEQENIGRRLKMDNSIGSIKHLYIVSSFSGDVILYSTVKGKITSSGKRLSPYSVAAGAHGYGTSKRDFGVPVSVGGNVHRTSEVLQDDGTYGSSIPYVYWWDTAGVYRQVFITGGMFPIVSERPMAFPKIILNVDDSWDPGTGDEKSPPKPLPEEPSPS